MRDGRLRLGVAGLGRAFQLMLPGLIAHEKIALAAAADPRPEARLRFTTEFGGVAYETVEGLCSDVGVDALYIASPHQFHAEHVKLAARHGKHVLVEKPMALSLADGSAMVASVEAASLIMVVGHSHSFDAPVSRTAELIASGAYGRLRMISAMNFSDFLYRPRRDEELSTALGGGVIFNQAPHHVDVVRLLAGAPVTRVRAEAGAWDETRPTEGAYAAMLNFENGVLASLVYSGYGHFDSDEFMGWIGESGAPKDPGIYGQARAALQGAQSRSAENALKAALNYGGKNTPSSAGTLGSRWHQQFGLLIASCEGADLRPLPNGVLIYGHHARHLEPLPPPTFPRKEVLDEFCAAVLEGKRPLHDGAWGLATMETCFAILQSHRERREIVLPRPMV